MAFIVHRALAIVRHAVRSPAHNRSRKANYTPNKIKKTPLEINQAAFFIKT